MPARVERQRAQREPTDTALASVLKAARMDDELIKAKWPDFTDQMGTSVRYALPPKGAKAYSVAALVGNRQK